MSQSGAKQSRAQDKVAALREAERQERRRRLVAVGTVSAVVLGVIGVAGYLSLRPSADPSAGTGLVGIGADATCQEDVVKSATGGGDHVTTPVDYPDSPPAFGPHFPQWVEVTDRKFYAEGDRPPVEALVHNLEHGYTILWYDQTVADDDQAMSEVEDIVGRFPGPAVEDGKFLAVPWTSKDGDAFPDGAHVALTHWSMGADGSGQEGVWRYCSGPNGDAVDAFVKAYPWSDSPEPYAG